LVELNRLRFGLVHGVECHFQQYFSYIVVIRFIGGGNQSTQRKPPTGPSNEKER
jgi:hypothetical protein